MRRAAATCRTAAHAACGCQGANKVSARRQAGLRRTGAACSCCRTCGTGATRSRAGAARQRWHVLYGGGATRQPKGQDGAWVRTAGAPDRCAAAQAKGPWPAQTHRGRPSKVGPNRTQGLQPSSHEGGWRDARFHAHTQVRACSSEGRGVEPGTNEQGARLRRAGGW